MSAKTYTLIVRWHDHTDKPQTTLLTGLAQTEGMQLYDVYTSGKSLVWGKLINDQTGRVWIETTGEVQP